VSYVALGPGFASDLTGTLVFHSVIPNMLVHLKIRMGVRAVLDG
jgi:hypothetical protein